MWRPLSRCSQTTEADLNLSPSLTLTHTVFENQAYNTVFIARTHQRKTHQRSRLTAQTQRARLVSWPYYMNFDNLAKIERGEKLLILSHSPPNSSFLKSTPSVQYIQSFLRQWPHHTPASSPSDLATAVTRVTPSALLPCPPSLPSPHLHQQ